MPSPATLSTLDRDYTYTLTTTGKLCVYYVCICSMSAVKWHAVAASACMEPTNNKYCGSIVIVCSFFYMEL